MQKLKYAIIMFFFLCLFTTISSVSAINIYNVTNESYSNYFDSSGHINDTNVVGGDVLDCSGTISNKNMYIDRPLNITSTDKTALFLNGTITILAGGSGTNITNLKINNSLDNCKGIYLLNTENNTIQGNTIHSDGTRGYCIALVGSNHNKIIGNNLSEYETENGWTHSPLVLGDSHYNDIVNNYIVSYCSNCIYLCMYPFADYANENPCTHNNITGNTLFGVDNSYCYAIQVMGGYNTVSNNTITGAYRGVSSEQDTGGNTIIGNTIAATYCGIYVMSNCTVSGNRISGYDSTHSGVTVDGSGAVVSGNVINLAKGYGIELIDSNCLITGNNITTSSNEAIYVNGKRNNNNITTNTINSGSTGILLGDSDKIPKNTVVTGNHINTTSSYAVISTGANNSTITNNYLVSNNGILEGNAAVSFNETDTISDNYGNSPLSKTKTYKITNDNYSTYFDTSGHIINSAVVSGDTFDLSGVFTNKNMIINIPLTITSSDLTAVLINGTIKIVSGGSGTNVTNLVINNSNNEGIGIFLYETENNTIQGNNIHCNGIDGFGIALERSPNNYIIGNTVKTSVRPDTPRTHTAIVLGVSNNNTIMNNYVVSDGADCIYLSGYDSDSRNFKSGGFSYYNKIINNTCVGANTKWCYAIQLMGAYNSVIGNTVTGAYYGISSQNDNGGNVIIANNIAAINMGISFSSNCTVSGNNIYVSGDDPTGIPSGISATGSDALITGNIINLSRGYGIRLTGSNCLISGNNITTCTNEAIYVQGQVTGNTISGNNISSSSTGVILKKQSSNKKPQNTSITDNHITTTSSYAVNSSEAANSSITNNYLVSNNGTSEGNNAVSYTEGDVVSNNYGKTPVVTSKTYKITNDNYSTYFDTSGHIINSAVVSGDTFDLSGIFTNKNMIINIPLTITSSDLTAVLINGTIKIVSGGSGSNVTNLVINNSNEDGIGIFLYETENNTIQGNTIHCNGLYGFGIALVRSPDNYIIGNSVTTSLRTDGKQTHTAIVLGESNNNTLMGNYVESDGANCIYICNVDASLFESSGLSYYNKIINNTCIGVGSETSYAIQVMGAYNSVINNTISGAYRGISSQQDTGGNTIMGNTIAATYNGIYIMSNCTVSGNKITGYDSTHSGITVDGSGAVVSDNVITLVKGYGIELLDSNCLITGNNINTSINEAIYVYGKVTGNNITANTINTNSTGVLLKYKSSSTSKHPSNTIIADNHITTSSGYAVDTREGDTSNVSHNYLVSDNGNKQGNNAVISATSDIVLDNYGKTPITVFNVTDANYNNYFDSNGLLKTHVVTKGSTLQLWGDFYNRNFTINLPVTVVGYGAILHNGTIKITGTGSGTSIYNITIINDNQKGIILFGSENNTIENNTIIVNDSQESYGIYLYDSQNNKIRANKITNTGDFITIGILLYESNNNQIYSNTVNTKGTSIQLPFLSSITLSPDIGVVNEIFPTYGILLLYSSLNNLTANIVTLTSGFTTPTMPNNTCMNSMVGIDLYYDCHNNNVSNNNITVIGNNPFSYGLGVLGAVWGTDSTSAENNVFSGNNVKVNGTYFATGFIAGLGSLNTTFNNNVIDVSAQNYSYGVTLESSTASIISKNIVHTSSDVNYAFELFKSNNNTIEENEILAVGNYSYGVAGSNSNKNTIIKNNITTLGNGSNGSGTYHGDVIPVGNAGIYMIGGSSGDFPNNNISFNRINTTGVYAVNTTGSSNNTITYNYLYSNAGNLQGNSAVSPGPGDVLTGNYGDLSSSISGTVRDAYDNSTGDYVGELADAVPVSGVTVNLRSQSNYNQLISTTTTDSSGAYAFYNLLKGNYTVELIYRTYKTFLQNVTLSNGSITLDHTFIPDIAIIAQYGANGIGQYNKMQALKNMSCRVYTINSYQDSSNDNENRHWMLEYANFILVDMYSLQSPTVTPAEVANSTANSNRMIAYIFGIYSPNFLSGVVGDWNFLGSTEENNTPNTLENTYIGSYWQAQYISDSDVVSKNMRNMLDYIFYLLGESAINPTEVSGRTPVLSTANWGIYHPDYSEDNHMFASFPDPVLINEWIKADPGYNSDGVGSLNWMTNEFVEWSSKYGKYSDTNDLFNAFESWYNSTKQNLTGSFVVIVSYYPGGALVDAMIRAYEAKGVPVFNLFQYSTNPPISELLRELTVGVNGTGPLSRGVIAVNSLYDWSMDYANMTNGTAIDDFDAMNIEIIKAVNSISQYSYTSDFGPQAEWTYAVTIPEFEGVFGAVVVSYTDSNSIEIPIQTGIDKVVQLTIGWATLKEKANQDKKVAIVLYDYPPGKANIAASYLNVFQSLHDLLVEMYDAGYNIGMTKSEIPSAEGLYTIIAEFGNKGSWAQGLLNTYFQDNYANLTANNQLVDLAQYTKWFNELPKTLQDELVAQWGSGLGNVMVYNNQYIVIPGIVCGNVFITVQPSRGWEELVSAEDYHSATLPPHQEYVSFYKWLDEVFQADAVINFGTHGTLEWLPGRQIGLQADDWTFQLSTIPSIYPFITSDPGEGMVAKDRAFALVISHMTPATVASELYGDYVKMQNYITAYMNALKVNATDLAEQYEAKIKDVAVNSLGLNAPAENQTFNEWVNSLDGYLEQLQDDIITLGLHTLGQALQGDDLIQETITIASSRTQILNNIKLLLYPSLSIDYFSMLTDINYRENVSSIKGNLTYYITKLVNGTSLDDLAKEIGINNETSLYANLNFCVKTISQLSTNTELEAIMTALSGGYIVPGLAGDPSWTDCLPTGTSMFSTDSTKMPSEAAWESAKKIVNKQLVQYYQEHGTFPDTVTLIMWGTELLRTEGIGMAQFLYFLGVKPNWEADGTVTGVQLINLSDLTITLDNGTVINRPRIDVLALAVTSNVDWIKLMNDAVYLVNATNESADVNFVKKHYAEVPSLNRVFGLPGNVLEGTGMSDFLPNTSKWDSLSDLSEKAANIVFSRISYAWTANGNKVSVTQDLTTFKYLLKNTDIITQNIDSTWRLLDSSDYYDWLGSAVFLSQSLGANPDVMIPDIRNMNQITIRSLSEELNFETNSMLLNPKYYNALLNEGPSGWLEYASKIENLFAFNAIAKDTNGNNLISDATMNLLANSLLSSAFNVNADYKAFAFQSMAGWLITAYIDGMWNADPNTIKNLMNAYIPAVINYGVVCCHHTCANIDFNNKLIQGSSLSTDQLQQYADILKAATGMTLTVGSKSSQSTDSASSSQSGSASSSSTSSGASSGQSTAGDQPSTSSDTGSESSSDSTGADGSSKSYEVSEKSSSSAPQSSTPIVAIVGVILLVGLVGFGYFGGDIMQFFKK
nr:cobaltochelatase subunit CobN [uncultured Methanobacterium sp.]